MHLLKQSLLLIIFCFLPFILIAQSNSSAESALVYGAEAEELPWGPCPEFMPESCRISVLHGDPTKPNTDVFFKLQGNTTAPEHTHTSAERMVLVSGELEVDYEGQEPSLMTAGDYGYGPPEKPHVASCISDEPCILFIAFEEPIDAFPVNENR